MLLQSSRYSIHTDSNLSSLQPAKTETKSFSLSMAASGIPLRIWSTASSSKCGFTQMKMISQLVTTSPFALVVVTPKSRHFCKFSRRGPDTNIWLDFMMPRLISPDPMANAIFPPPTNPIRSSNFAMLSLCYRLCSLWWTEWCWNRIRQMTSFSIKKHCYLQCQYIEIPQSVFDTICDAIGSYARAKKNWKIRGSRWEPWIWKKIISNSYLKYQLEEIPNGENVRPADVDSDEINKQQQKNLKCQIHRYVTDVYVSYSYTVQLRSIETIHLDKVSFMIRNFNSKGCEFLGLNCNNNFVVTAETWRKCTNKQCSLSSIGYKSIVVSKSMLIQNFLHGTMHYKSLLA